jgi:hypothetical protein
MTLLLIGIIVGLAFALSHLLGRPRHQTVVFIPESPEHGGAGCVTSLFIIVAALLLLILVSAR